VWSIDATGNRQLVEIEPMIFWLSAEFLTWHLGDLSDWMSRARCNVIRISKVAEAAFQKEASGPGQVIMLNLTKLKRDLFAALKIESEETSVSAQTNLAERYG
jgi:hypothetical protein